MSAGGDPGAADTGARGQGAGPSLPAPLLRFLDLLERGAYWESHEALEEAWRERRSGFYHGLILYASAFVHAARGNAHGVRAQLGKAERALAPYAPAYLGLDVEAILEHARRCRAVVRGSGGAGEAGEGAAAEEGAATDAAAGGAGDPEWKRRLPFPELRPDPALVRGDEPELSELRADPTPPPGSSG